MLDIVIGGWSDTWRTDLGYASVRSPDIRPPPQTISYTYDKIVNSTPSCFRRQYRPLASDREQFHFRIFLLVQDILLGKTRLNFHEEASRSCRWDRTSRTWALRQHCRGRLESLPEDPTSFPRLQEAWLPGH